MTSFRRVILDKVEVRSLVWTRITVKMKVAIFKKMFFFQDLNAKVMKVEVFNRENYILVYQFENNCTYITKNWIYIR